MKVLTVVPKMRRRLEDSARAVPATDSDDSDEEDDLFSVAVFSCGKCNEPFGTRRKLQWHVRRQHMKVRKKLFKKISSRSWHSRDRVRGEGKIGKLTLEGKLCSKDDAVGSAVSAPSSPVLDVQKSLEINAPSKQRQWRNSKCSVVLTRLKIFEIKVTTPSKGLRNISYTVEANSSGSESSLSSTKSSLAKYDQWRQVTIKALPRKIKAPEPPSVPKPPSVDALDPASLPSPPSSSVGDSKSLNLQLPPELSSMFNVNGFSDDLHSIVDIITGYKMSCDVLDAYLTRRLASYNNEINVGIRNAYKLRALSTTKFHLLSSRFLPVLYRDQSNMFLPKRQHLPNAALDDNSVLIAPLYSCKHLFLAVFNCYTKCVYVYDSSWKFVPHQLRLDQVLKILTSVFPHSSHRWTIYFEFKCAQQFDEVSCGCYVIYFTENHLKSKSHRNIRNMSKTELTQLRVEIATELLPTTKTGSRFLEAITE